VEEWLQTQPDPVEMERRVIAIQPLRRMAAPADIANVVAFVASDEASAITGASLAADCGLGIMFAT
jgi:NAD(P)-dependent dehydrogenase (short-subunit alcohol dehydrogenase family)